ncbi:MAG: hypothetical protein JO306_08565 [Gemmatimonadetes bacterium]|nr:hypothetical protein [Gemmatimonadota bacterium]
MEHELASDPVLEEIWAIRERLGERFGNDVRKLGEYYMEFQKQFAERLVPAPTDKAMEVKDDRR